MKVYLIERFDCSDDVENRANELYTWTITRPGGQTWMERGYRYVMRTLTETKDGYTAVFKYQDQKYSGN